MKLYRTALGAVLEFEGELVRLPTIDWDELVNRDDLAGWLSAALKGGTRLNGLPEALAPVVSQEVWAAGVTYWRSRTARMVEAQDAGGGSFYDRVYEAERPELFFKSPGWRVRGTGQPLRIRRDSRWNVPEPELALYVNARGRIIGYTIGNDMSSRDIEGENPLYLPQAKVYDGSCGLGPAVLLHEGPLPPDTEISIAIMRNGAAVFEGTTRLEQMRRKPEDLVAYLYRETSFPAGAVLLTGTGIVPPDDFTLAMGDEVRIAVPPIGALANRIE